MAVFAAPAGERLDEHRPAIGQALSRDRATVEHVADGDRPVRGRHRVRRRPHRLRRDHLRRARRLELGAAPVAALADALAAGPHGGLSRRSSAATPRSSTPRLQTSGAEAIGLVAALVVLVVAFGTVVAALVPIVLALVAVATGLSAIALLANGMDVSTAAPTIAAMIGLGVGIDYALFIVARYRENRAAGRTTRAALSTGAWAPRASAVLSSPAAPWSWRWPRSC